MIIANAMDVESIALRLLCEKAEDRLEHAWAAAELACRTVQLPDGSYHWASAAGVAEDSNRDQPR